MEKWYQVKKVFFGSKDVKTYSFFLMHKNDAIYELLKLRESNEK